MREPLGRPQDAHHNRRSLERIAPPTRMHAAVENTTRQHILGMAEVADFSALGLGLRGIAGDPVAALGDSLYLTLVVDEGIIPLQAVITHIRKEGLMGVRVAAFSSFGEHFLIRLHQELSSVQQREKQCPAPPLNP